MSQSTAKPHALNTDDERAVRVEGDEGRQALVTKDPQLQLLESIDASLKKIAMLLEANL